MKPTIFIGSSSEGLRLARAIKQELSKTFIATVWDEGLFSLGHNTLDDLLRFVQCFDFAVLVLTEDDHITSRGETTPSPRDNVVLELGLFMGALGRRRTFPVIAPSSTARIKVPSDLLGTTLTMLPKDFHKAPDQPRLEAELKNLVSTVQERSAESTLQLLPSTGLAIGYFMNFVLPVCEKLAAANFVEVEGQQIDISRDNFDFTIVLPRTLSDASIQGAQKFVKSRGVKPFKIEAGRAYPFYVNPVLMEDRVVFYDYPTTLRASHEAVRIAFAGPYLGRGKDEKILDQKEIHNFQRTILILLDEPSAAEFRDNVKFIVAP